VHPHDERLRGLIGRVVRGRHDRPVPRREEAGGIALASVLYVDVVRLALLDHTDFHGLGDVAIQVKETHRQTPRRVTPQRKVAAIFDFLRGVGTKARILLMTGIWRGEEDEIVAENLTPTIWEAWQINALERAASQRQSTLPVHLKIDTGMNRLGASLVALPHLCETLSACKHVALEGVSTHFASAEVLDAEDAVRQMKAFEEGLTIVRSYGLRPPLVHMGNSAAMTARPETWKTMVRPGIALYGYSLPFTRGGGPASVAELPLRPVLSWKTRVLTVKEVATGQAVGYMGTFVTKEKSRIAVLPVGYADGYPRLLSNRARVIVGGEYAPVVGRVSMDLTIVDVTHIQDVAVGDEVVLIGKSNGKNVDAVELARWCETVPYEILCGLSQRVPRVYF